LEEAIQALVCTPERYRVAIETNQGMLVKTTCLKVAIGFTPFLHRQ
jgi:hypothetical protein